MSKMDGWINPRIKVIWTCGECEGTGRLIINRLNLATGSSIITDETPCPVCHGECYREVWMTLAEIDRAMDQFSGDLGVGGDAE